MTWKFSCQRPHQTHITQSDWKSEKMNTVIPQYLQGIGSRTSKRQQNPRMLKSLIDGVVQSALHLICSWLNPGMWNPQLGRANCIPLSPTPAFIQPPNSLLMSSQVNQVRGFWYLEKISWLLAITFFWIPFNREWTLCRWKFSWRETITAQLAPWTQDNAKQGTPATTDYTRSIDHWAFKQSPWVGNLLFNVNVILLLCDFRNVAKFLV